MAVGVGGGNEWGSSKASSSHSMTGRDGQALHDPAAFEFYCDHCNYTIERNHIRYPPHDMQRGEAQIGMPSCEGAHNNHVLWLWLCVCVSGMSVWSVRASSVCVATAMTNRTTGMTWTPL